MDFDDLPFGGRFSWEHICRLCQLCRLVDIESTSRNTAPEQLTEELQKRGRSFMTNTSDLQDYQRTSELQDYEHISTHTSRYFEHANQRAIQQK